ncbi:MAG: hypothetical protein EXQ86_02430, partial [Rhodospirillales bacterium]|nr:hypothetical protein [Rhodospirillales bacterium]
DPLQNWLKGPLRPWVSEIISSKSFRTRGLFDVKKVDAAYADYVAADSPENAFHVWQWVSMELWYRTFIDGDGSRPPGN